MISANSGKIYILYYILLLLLQVGLLGVFCARDLLLFYVFFEFTLIPLYFLIGIWGGPKREYAAIKFFLYTFAGSVLMLVALIAMRLHTETLAADGLLTEAGRVLTSGTFSIPTCARRSVTDSRLHADNRLRI